MTAFHQLLRTAASEHGARTAILFEEHRLTYDALLAQVEALASGLAGRGIGPRDHVAIIMDNSVQCVLSWLACSLIGCTEVPINPQYRGDLLHYLLEDSGTRVILCDARYRDQVLAVAARLPGLRQMFVNGGNDIALAGAVPIHDLDACAAFGGFAEVTDAPERIILYTSGTTGPSKGVVHTQASMLGLARYNASVMGYGPDDRLLNFFPLFHQNARYTGVVPALCSGASIRIERKLSTSTFWETCRRDRITAFNYLGSVLRMVLNVTGPDMRAGDHSVTRAFGAGATPDIWQEFEDRLGIRLFETYGLSEAPMATINVPGPDRCPPGSAGRASALFEVAVFDGDDRPLPPREVGEIVLRPRRADALMIGYHNKPDATVEAFRNLWFHSGDRGYLTETGDLYFEERAKDSIRRRGENISAWEVESILQQHPAVAEAAVYGLRCDDRDEEVAASIVPAAGADLAAIHAFAVEHLPSYAVPTLMRFASDLPRTPTAKVRKDDLRTISRGDHVDFSSPAAAGDGAERARAHHSSGQNRG